jgi:hypothetical protein
MAALSALRDVETALLQEEAALDGYVASADAALKTEFEGPARAATDAAFAAALSRHNDLETLRDRITAWRRMTEIDVLALARQPSICLTPRTARPTCRRRRGSRGAPCRGA